MKFNMEYLINLIYPSVLTGLLFGWLKSYVKEKFMIIEQNKDRILNLEGSLKYKEERLTKISESLEALVASTNTTNISIAKLELLFNNLVKESK